MAHSTRPAIASALAAMLAAAGCVTSGPADEPGTPDGAPRDAGVDGDAYLRAGDPDRAAVLFEIELAKAPDDPVMQEKVRTAKRLAAQHHAQLSAAAARDDDFQLAALELEKAERFDKDAAPVRKLHQALASKLAVTREVVEARGRAKELMATDPAAALDLLTDLRRSAPYDPEIVELLTQATKRTEADRAAARAEEAWAAGVRTRAVEHLAAADYAGSPVPRAQALRRRMETDLVAESSSAGLAALRDARKIAMDARLQASTTDLLRDRLADVLAKEVRTHESAGHPATAALFELEAQRIGVRAETRNLDRVRTERATWLHVLPFDDATGGSVDGLRLSRALRDRIALDAAGGSAVLVTTDEAPAAGAAFPHLVVTGTAKSMRITSGRVGRETVKVRYVAGMREAENPAAADLTVALAAARRSLTLARDRVLSAETSLRQLEALGFGRGPGGTVGTEADVAYQTRLATARAALENAQRGARAAEQDEFSVRQQILATPSTVSDPVWKEEPVEVTTLVKTAEVVVQVVVRDGATPLLDQVVTGADIHRETVAPAFDAAALAADPDETPDDAEMAARAFDKFSDAAAGAVRACAEQAARRLLENARATERRGDTGAAVEIYAVFLLSTSETATPERAAAAKALFEILGAVPALHTGFRPESRR